MVLVVVFGAALLVAVLAARPSTFFVFLVGGALAGDNLPGLIHITPDSEMVSVAADLALFAMLFTDGVHVFPSQAARQLEEPGTRPGPGHAARLRRHGTGPLLPGGQPGLDGRHS